VYGRGGQILDEATQAFGTFNFKGVPLSVFSLKGALRQKIGKRFKCFHLSNSIKINYSKNFEISQPNSWKK
jgi:hypothetical protein